MYEDIATSRVALKCLKYNLPGTPGPRLFFAWFSRSSQEKDRKIPCFHSYFQSITTINKAQFKSVNRLQLTCSGHIKNYVRAIRRDHVMMSRS